MLKIINLKIERFCKKLDHRFLNFYEVIQRIEFQFYKLKLSASHKMHSMFHISLLKSYRENTIDKRTSLSLLSVEAVTEQEVNEREYEIDQILKSKRHYEKIKYYVKWKNYEKTSKERTWESSKNLLNAQKFVIEFHERHSIMSKSWTRTKSQTRERNISRYRERNKNKRKLVNEINANCMNRLHWVFCD